MIIGVDYHENYSETDIYRIVTTVAIYDSRAQHLARIM